MRWRDVRLGTERRAIIRAMVVKYSVSRRRVVMCGKGTGIDVVVVAVEGDAADGEVRGGAESILGTQISSEVRFALSRATRRVYCMKSFNGSNSSLATAVSDRRAGRESDRARYFLRARVPTSDLRAKGETQKTVQRSGVVKATSRHSWQTRVRRIGASLGWNSVVSEAQNRKIFCRISRGTGRVSILRPSTKFLDESAADYQPREILKATQRHCAHRPRQV